MREVRNSDGGLRALVSVGAERRGFAAVLDSIGALPGIALVFIAHAAVRFPLDAQQDGTP